MSVTFLNFKYKKVHKCRRRKGGLISTEQPMIEFKHHSKRGGEHCHYILNSDWEVKASLKSINPSPDLNFSFSLEVWTRSSITHPTFSSQSGDTGLAPRNGQCSKSRAVLGSALWEVSSSCLHVLLAGWHQSFPSHILSPGPWHCPLLWVWTYVTVEEEELAFTLHCTFTYITAFLILTTTGQPDYAAFITVFQFHKWGRWGSKALRNLLWVFRL